MKPTRGAVLLLSLLIVVPSFGQRSRAVRPGGGVNVVAGIVTDVDTGRPVVQAEVTSGRTGALTNAEGRFELNLPVGQPSTITVKRSGYDTQTITVTPVAGSTIQVRLKSKSTVTLRTIDGTTYQLDLETAQFAYVTPFSGYIRTDAGNFCKTDGTPLQPDKSLIRRVTGPAVPTTGTACCTTGPVLKIDLELKSGERIPVYLIDSCVGYQMEFLGRDHTTAEWRYVKFTDVAEIVFP